jgi:acrylyl-CoA reductase (NADPH)
LAKILAHTQLWGNVGAIGLAESHELHTTVMPFILRGVSLVGISSNNTPVELRHKIWHRLGGDLKPANLDSFVTETVSLEGVVAQAEKMLSQQTHGRTVVSLGQT